MQIPDNCARCHAGRPNLYHASDTHGAFVSCRRCGYEFPDGTPERKGQRRTKYGGEASFQEVQGDLLGVQTTG